jgi:hypothetical protein
MAKKRTSESELVASTGATPVPARRRTDAASHKTRTPAMSGAEPIMAALAVSTPVSGPTHDQIASLAYSYWAARGFQHGSAEEDWQRAEDELRLTAKAAQA